MLTRENKLSFPRILNFLKKTKSSVLNEVNYQDLTEISIESIKEVKHTSNDTLPQNKPTYYIEMLKLPLESIPIGCENEEWSEEQLAIEQKTKEKYLKMWRKNKHKKKVSMW